MGKRVTTALGGILLAITAAVVLTPGLSASDRLVSAKDGQGNQLLLSVNPETGSAHRVYGELADVSRYGFRSVDLEVPDVVVAFDQAAGDRVDEVHDIPWLRFGGKLHLPCQ